MGGCDKFPQVVLLWFGGGYVFAVVFVLCFEHGVLGSVRVGRMVTFFGSRGCCWVQFRGLNFGIRLGLRDSGAQHILVVKRVLKLNKRTKHWCLQAFINIAARVQ